MHGPMKDHHRMRNDIAIVFFKALTRLKFTILNCIKEMDLLQDLAIIYIQ